MRQWFKDLYQDNKLISMNSLGDRRSPTQHNDAGAEHLRDRRYHRPRVVLEGSAAISEPTTTPRYLFGGHIGTFVGGKAQKVLAPTLADWFKAHG
jgi:polyhydroxyalkanoate synthase